MSISNRRDFEQLKSSLNIENLVKTLLPNGKGKTEWIVKNPTRNDKNSGSFRINLITGLWIDFATNEGGDIFDLYAYLHGCTITDAYDNLSQNISKIPALKCTPKKEKPPEENSKITIITPVPDDAGEPIFGKHENYWCYRDSTGNPLMYVSRHKRANGDKYFMPHTYRQKETGWAYWDNKGFEDAPWPLYNLDVLANFPTANVLIVEGEKTADAASRILNDWVCVTWHGGAGAVSRTDLEPLRGRNVWIWRDNDEPGMVAQKTLIEKLKGVSASLFWVDLSTVCLSKGWDLADGLNEGITKEDCMELIEKAKQEIEPINPATFPDLSANRRPLNTTENIQHLLNHFNVKVRYNLMTNYPEFYVAGRSFSLVNEADCYFTEISNLCVRSGVPKVDLAAHLIYIADKKRFHPAIEFIESKPWDGISRIKDLLNTVRSPKQELSNKLIYRWLLSCIAALYLPAGIASEGALIFQGEQKIGKTYWLLKLLPLNFRHLVKEGVSINVDNKDDVIKATNVWIAELGEIGSTFKKSDIDALKNFITRSVDEYRVPFGRLPRKVPRRTIFYGSVNTTHFLADTTGNRRFWTIPVNKINYEHTIDMQQLWAEVKVLFDKGESYRLTSDEQDFLNESNKDHEYVDPIEEILLTQYLWDNQIRRNMTPTQLLQELNMPIDKMRRNNVADILRRLKIPSVNLQGTLYYKIPLVNFRACE